MSAPDCCWLRALDERAIADVSTRLTRTAKDVSVPILQQHGYPLITSQVAHVIDAPEK